MIFRSAVLLFFSGLAARVAAQSTANCDPLVSSCPPDPALGGSISLDFTQGSSSHISPVYSPDDISYTSDMGMKMTINQLGDGPTVASDFYIFFGKVEVVAQCAPGTGIVSSVVLISDDNDEIDLEWTGGDAYHVQTNYFSKGQTGSYDRGGMTDVANPQSTFHTYTIDWNRDSITWYVDGAVARVLPSNAPEGYPQTPMQIKIGSWVGGSPDNAPGTIAWAGGLTDFSQAPFNFYIQSLKVTDYSTGTEYVYSDNSGSEDSIQAVSGSPGGLTSETSFGTATSSSASADPITTTDPTTSTSSVESTSSSVTSTVPATSSSSSTLSSTTSSSLTSTTSSSLTSTTSSSLSTSSTTSSSLTSTASSLTPSSTTSSSSASSSTSIAPSSSSASSWTASTLSSSSSSLSSPPAVTSSTSPVSFLVGSASALSTLAGSTIASPIPVHNMTSVAFVSTLSTVTISSNLTSTVSYSGFVNRTSSATSATRSAGASASTTRQPVAVQTTNASISAISLGSNKLWVLFLSVVGVAIVLA
ncbi:concanavalin A-like lectin/glucanase domain-containing protein [Lipomyces doorenjongii]|uniref:concanavalin A-like lectin/glucanase domain-containing protein n=1 Tax=Lipomyces doorenjongii TaxID=383834 RepID=UPI0034CF068B